MTSVENYVEKFERTLKYYEHFFTVPVDTKDVYFDVTDVFNCDECPDTLIIFPHVILSASYFSKTDYTFTLSVWNNSLPLA